MLLCISCHQAFTTTQARRIVVVPGTSYHKTQPWSLEPRPVGPPLVAGPEGMSLVHWSSTYQTKRCAPEPICSTLINYIRMCMLCTHLHFKRSLEEELPCCEHLNKDKITTCQKGADREKNCQSSRSAVVTEMTLRGREVTLKRWTQGAIYRHLLFLNCH